MAKAAEYGLGPHAFPRGWFIVAECSELDAGPLAVRFFGQDFALYRGASGRVVLLDAYCAHMGTHLTASKSAIIVVDGKQIEGDSIRCPYHGWRYGPDGQLNDIPYHDGPCPKTVAVKSHTVREVMGCVMMWHDPEGGPPLFEPPMLQEWDDPAWVHWQLDHLDVLQVHGQELMDNMADVQHLGPTHGAPCEYFENELIDHICIQRQGGFQKAYNAFLATTTWYTGPGLLLSKQEFGDVLTYELIANTPVEDGVTKVWHGALTRAQNVPHTEADIAAARTVQAGALQAFSADFEVWRNKRPAIRIMQLRKDGPFRTMRQWYGQFYDERSKVGQYHAKLNGRHPIHGFERPGDRHMVMEGGLFG